MPPSKDTICALATPTGGALAVIRVSGPAAHQVVSAICRKTAEPNMLQHTTVVTPAGEVVDEVMVVLFHAPNSYTGEDGAELSCHGSPYIASQVLQLLTSQGCRMAQPGEFTMRAYLNGKLDLAQAEAVADLIASTTRSGHRMAMAQLRGHFSSELSKLREQLLQLTSLLELELDFSDHEELEFANRDELLQLATHISQRISTLTRSFKDGQALKHGIPVAIIGAPNVGKSTLLNALAGEERAIVSDQEGTTRDTIEDVLTIGGIQFRFIDTAGLRHTADTIERMGIDRALNAAAKATIVLLITQPGVPFSPIDTSPGQTVIRILNKSDLLAPVSGGSAPHPTKPGPHPTKPDPMPSKPDPMPTAQSDLMLSAKTGHGMEALRQRLLAVAPHPADNDVIVSSARHHDALMCAQASLQRVIEGLHASLSSDLLAEDLRLTLNHLASITGGQITPQETLNNIFQHFCVGK